MAEVLPLTASLDNELQQKSVRPWLILYNFVHLHSFLMTWSSVAEMMPLWRVSVERCSVLSFTDVFFFLAWICCFTFFSYSNWGKNSLACQVSWDWESSSHSVLGHANSDAIGTHAAPSFDGWHCSVIVLAGSTSNTLNSIWSKEMYLREREYAAANIH